MLWKRVIVGDQERILMARNGRFSQILEPGRHRIFTVPGVSLELEKHNVSDLTFRSKWSDYLLQERPEVVSRYFTRVETNAVQIAMVYVDSQLAEVLLPAKCALYWRGWVEVTAETIDVITQLEIPASKFPARGHLGRNAYVRQHKETEPTHPLLNTGELFEENLILVRLQELETLEKLVGETNHLPATGGFEGLLDNLIVKSR